MFFSSCFYKIFLLITYFEHFDCSVLCCIVCLVKTVVFPVVMYGCESWTIKLRAEELMLLNCGVGEDS